MYRRRFLSGLARISAGGALIGATGCSGGGTLSGEPKKYEGGGPLPEMKEDEINETSPKAKAKAKAKTKNG